MTKHDYIIPIRISGLSDGLHHFDLLSEPQRLNLPAEFDTDFTIHVDLDKTHSQLMLRIDIRSSATFLCDRCLAPVHIPIEQRFSLFYSRDISSARQFDEDDVRVIDPNEPVIDIAEDVRDFALIGIPMRRTCGEDSDGRSLCVPAITVDEESEMRIDTRWEKLREWQQTQR